MSQTQKQKFRDLLSEFETAVLITHGPGDHWRARPMAIAEVDGNGDVWFLTSRESAKVHEIGRDTEVQVVCQNGWTSCVSLRGRATLERDPIKIHALWRAAYRVWFPLGVNDPDIILIHVTGEEGEYWDNQGVNRLTYAFQAVKAMATGTKPEISEGKQYGHVQLSDGPFTNPQF